METRKRSPRQNQTDRGKHDDVVKGAKSRSAQGIVKKQIIAKKSSAYSSFENEHDQKKTKADTKVKNNNSAGKNKGKNTSLQNNKYQTKTRTIKNISPNIQQEGRPTHAKMISVSKDITQKDSISSNLNTEILPKLKHKPTVSEKEQNFECYSNSEIESTYSDDQVQSIDVHRKRRTKNVRTFFQKLKKNKLIKAPPPVEEPPFSLHSTSEYYSDSEQMGVLHETINSEYDSDHVPLTQIAEEVPEEIEEEEIDQTSVARNDKAESSSYEYSYSYSGSDSDSKSQKCTITPMELSDYESAEPMSVPEVKQAAGESSDAEKTEGVQEEEIAPNDDQKEKSYEYTYSYYSDDNQEESAVKEEVPKTESDAKKEYEYTYSYSEEEIPNEKAEEMKKEPEVEEEAMEENEKKNEYEYTYSYYTDTEEEKPATEEATEEAKEEVEKKEYEYTYSYSEDSEEGAKEEQVPSKEESESKQSLVMSQIYDASDEDREINKEIEKENEVKPKDELEKPREEKSQSYSYYSEEEEKEAKTKEKEKSQSYSYYSEEEEKLLKPPDTSKDETTKPKSEEEEYYSYYTDEKEEDKEPLKQEPIQKPKPVLGLSSILTSHQLKPKAAKEFVIPERSPESSDREKKPKRRAYVHSKRDVVYEGELDTPIMSRAMKRQCEDSSGTEYYEDLEDANEIIDDGEVKKVTTLEKIARSSGSDDTISLSDVSDTLEQPKPIKKKKEKKDDEIERMQYSFPYLGTSIGDVDNEESSPHEEEEDEEDYDDFDMEGNEYDEPNPEEEEAWGFALDDKISSEYEEEEEMEEEENGENDSCLSNSDTEKVSTPKEKNEHSYYSTDEEEQLQRAQHKSTPKKNYSYSYYSDEEENKNSNLKQEPKIASQPQNTITQQKALVSEYSYYTDEDEEKSEALQPQSTPKNTQSLQGENTMNNENKEKPKIAAPASKAQEQKKVSDNSYYSCSAEEKPEIQILQKAETKEEDKPIMESNQKESAEYSYYSDKETEEKKEKAEYSYYSSSDEKEKEITIPIAVKAPMKPLIKPSPKKLVVSAADISYSDDSEPPLTPPISRPKLSAPNGKPEDKVIEAEKKDTKYKILKLSTQDSSSYSSDDEKLNPQKTNIPIQRQQPMPGTQSKPQKPLIPSKTKQQMNKSDPKPKEQSSFSMSTLLSMAASKTESQREFSERQSRRLEEPKKTPPQKPKPRSEINYNKQSIFTLEKRLESNKRIEEVLKKRQKPNKNFRSQFKNSKQHQKRGFLNHNVQRNQK